MFGMNKIKKIDKKIEEKMKELKKLEDKKKMKVEISGGAIKKTDNKVDEVTPFDKLFNKPAPVIQRPTPMVQPNITQQQEMQRQAAEEYARQQMYNAQVQAQQTQIQQAQLMAQQQAQIQQAQLAQQAQLMAQQQTLDTPLDEGDAVKVTIYLTEKEIIESFTVPLSEAEAVEADLDKAILQQGVFKLSGTSISGRHIKRYTIE